MRNRRTRLSTPCYGFLEEELERLREDARRLLFQLHVMDSCDIVGAMVVTR